MTNQSIIGILEKLHSNKGHPRLEIEGAGVPSVESKYLGWIENKKSGEGKSAVYIINDWYEDTSYITAYRTECIILPKSGIESLVESAQSLKGKADIQTKAIHIKHNERQDDYCSTYDGSPAQATETLVELSLDIQEEKPLFSLKQLPYLHYPNDLPAIAIANREALCINCEYVWLQPFVSRDPDSNHCSQMELTLKAYKGLSMQQIKMLQDLVGNGVLCPTFCQTTRYSK